MSTSESTAVMELPDPQDDSGDRQTDGQPPQTPGQSDVLCRVSPKKVAGLLALVAVCLAAASTITRLGTAAVEPGTYRGLVEIASRFDLDHEINIPTWYSSAVLLCCAGLLGMVTIAKKRTGGRYVFHWGLLALIFLYLSIDEAANLHEILIVPIRRRMGTQGIFYFAWVIPGAVGVGLFVLAYLRFLFHLDWRSRCLFVLAGLTYVGGALGMELVGGATADWYGLESLPYLLAMTTEETLEMLGAVIFIYALLDYVSRHIGTYRFRVAELS